MFARHKEVLRELREHCLTDVEQARAEIVGGFWAGAWGEALLKWGGRYEMAHRCWEAHAKAQNRQRLAEVAPRLERCRARYRRSARSYCRAVLRTEVLCAQFDLAAPRQVGPP